MSKILILLLLFYSCFGQQIINVRHHKPAGSGTETCGSTDTSGGNYDSGDSNTILFGYTCVPTHNSTVTNAQVYIGTAAGNLNMAVYDSDGTGGEPATMLCLGTQITTAAGWSVITFSSTCSLSSGHTYWIAANTSDATTQYLYHTGSSYYKGSQTCCTMASITSPSSNVVAFAMHLTLAY